MATISVTPSRVQMNQSSVTITVTADESQGWLRNSPGVRILDQNGLDLRLTINRVTVTSDSMFTADVMTGSWFGKGTLEETRSRLTCPFEIFRSVKAFSFSRLR
jgi:hypothetical protein